VTENPRIAELRRRVHKDPASIAFAQLAEEYRRAGDYGDAIRVCRAGLAQHPLYLSARITLARALLELNQVREAQLELEEVLRAAPDNMSAIRILAELRRRRAEAGAPDAPPAHPQPARLDNRSTAPDAFTIALEQLDALDVPIDPALAQLESWLDAILADRARRQRTDRGRA
jgi:predicted Zn-dependent protease